MKRFIAFALSIILLTVLSPCSKEKEKENADEASAGGGYLYGLAEGTVYKYNIETGYAAPLCSDPLCTHDNMSCPFYGVDNEMLFTDDGDIVYIRNAALMLYDVSEASSDTLFSSDGVDVIYSGIYHPYIANGYVFFNTFAYSDYGESDEVIINIYRCCLETKETVKLNDEELYDFQRILFSDNEIILWESDIDAYTTDYDYVIIEAEIDRNKIGGIIAGDFSYRLKIDSSKNGRYDFDLQNAETGETTLPGVTMVLGYKENLIVCYNADEDEARYIGADDTGVKFYEYLSNVIYIYDSDGENGRILCSIPDEYIIYTFNTVTKTLMSENYIGVKLKEYEFDDDGYVTGYDYAVDIIIINIETGEYKVTVSK